MRPAVFLDRDGVLNKVLFRNGSVGSPRCLDELELLPGVAQAVKKLRSLGLLVIVVTNQPDVSRGLIDPAELERMHRRLQQAIPIDAIYTCPHDDHDACGCRKPKPGLLLKAATDWAIALNLSYLVGDSWRDIEAGRAVGCKTFLVRLKTAPLQPVRPSYEVEDLQTVAETLAALPQPAIHRHSFR